MNKGQKSAEFFESRKSSSHEPPLIPIHPSSNGLLSLLSRLCDHSTTATTKNNTSEVLYRGNSSSSSSSSSASFC